MPGLYGLAGYHLKNTLSNKGGVLIGICSVKKCKLTRIVETKNIVKTETDAEVGGEAVDPDTQGMKLFAIVLPVLQDGSKEFFRYMKDSLTDE